MNMIPRLFWLVKLFFKNFHNFSGPGQGAGFPRQANARAPAFTLACFARAALGALCIYRENPENWCQLSKRRWCLAPLLTRPKFQLFLKNLHPN
jgi:hypothetical protein